MLAAFLFDRVSAEDSMSKANKALVRRWFEEVWNQGREETIDELFAANGVGYGLGDTEAPVHGPAEIKPFVRNLRGALPDIHMKIEDSIAEGDKVTVRITVEGTHKGAQLGVAPTGRRVRIEGIVVVRIANGQIVEGWNSWDQLGLLRQIGALAAEKGPDQFTTARSSTTAG
jgi:steroid delta-isomerase-like uncharacterized protein